MTGTTRNLEVVSIRFVVGKDLHIIAVCWIRHLLRKRIRWTYKLFTLLLYDIMKAPQKSILWDSSSSRAVKIIKQSIDVKNSYRAIILMPEKNKIKKRLILNFSRAVVIKLATLLLPLFFIRCLYLVIYHNCIPLLVAANFELSARFDFLTGVYSDVAARSCCVTWRIFLSMWRRLHCCALLYCCLSQLQEVKCFSPRHLGTRRLDKCCNLKSLGDTSIICSAG